jgi:hypothetical protein
MAKGFKSGGRQVGALNKSTLAKQALLAACTSTDPEAFLTAIMVSPSPLVTVRDRIDTAKALLVAKRWAKEEKPELVEPLRKPGPLPRARVLRFCARRSAWASCETAACSNVNSATLSSDGLSQRPRARANWSV